MVVVHNNLGALGVFLTGEAQAVLKSNSSSGHFPTPVSTPPLLVWLMEMILHVMGPQGCFSVWCIFHVLRLLLRLGFGGDSLEVLCLNGDVVGACHGTGRRCAYWVCVMCKQQNTSHIHKTPWQSPDDLLPFSTATKRFQKGGLTLKQP